jgi:hypothetical protein
MFTQSRVIALALITPLIAGLAYLRYAPDSSPVSVPEGAKAGGPGPPKTRAQATQRRTRPRSVIWRRRGSFTGPEPVHLSGEGAVRLCDDGFEHREINLVEIGDI